MAGAGLALLGLGGLFASFPLNGLVAGAAGLTLALDLVNLLLLKRVLFPYDRILSAVSVDGLQWRKEAGVRIDVGGRHRSVHVYSPAVVAVPGGYRMYYRAGGYRSIIASARSEDGLDWNEEAEVRVGLGGQHGLVRLDGPAAIGLGSGRGYWLFYGATDGARWRIFRSRSEDGLAWDEQVVVLDFSQDARLPNAMQPSIIETEAGYRLFFTRFNDEGETCFYTAVSSDGYHWEEVVPCLGYQIEGYAVRNPSVAPLPRGRLRLYFSEYPKGGSMDLGSRIASAVSADGRCWEREAGVRLEPGGEYDPHGVFCPYLVRYPSGWRMYYGGYLGRHWLEWFTLRQYRAKRKRLISA